MKKQIVYLIGFVLAAAAAVAGYFTSHHLMRIGIDESFRDNVFEGLANET